MTATRTLAFAAAAVWLAWWGTPPSQAADPIVPPVSERFAEASEETPSFQRHVGPLFGRLGCNGRSCHGSFQGRGGFQLSLFGYDFAADHAALLDEASPRINLADAAASLILNKPTSDEEHEGGKRYEHGGWEYHVFRQWIDAGAPFDAKKLDRLVDLQVTPSEIRFREAGEKLRLRVVAVWEDGAREDVTPLCRFQSNDDMIVKIDENGWMESGEPGDTHVVVFYDKAVKPLPVIQPVTDKIGDRYPDVAARTRVDELVIEKLRKLGVAPSDLCSDEEFLRRVSLDLTGTLPTAAEVRAFVADASPDKRAAKIDALLETPAYAAWWTTKLCDFTGNNDDQLVNVTPTRGAAAQQWYDWIYHRVAENAPYDDLVEGIVTASSKKPGQSYEEYCREMSELYRDDDQSFAEQDGMTHYWARRDFRMPPERAISFAYAFLGIRIQCAQCHKHPFDQWSKQDFDDFAPFFATVRLAPNGEPGDREQYNRILESLEVGEELRGNQLRREFDKLLKKGKTVPFPVVYSSPVRPQRNNAKKAKNARNREQEPTATTARLLGGDAIDLTEFDDVRQPLMQWLRDPQNPLFAKAFVNRVWASYFHVGIVEPPDDLSLANPPSNAALLDHLAAGFIAHDFDMKWVHREILNSDAYQRSWRPNDTNALDKRNFSRAIPRRLPAEVALDAIESATANDEAAARMLTDLQGRAIALPAAGPRQARSNVGFALTVFGRSTRESNCDCDRAMDPTLLQTVYLQNDNETLAKLSARDGWVVQTTGKPRAQDGPQRPANYDQTVAQMTRRISQLKEQEGEKAAEQLQRLEDRLAAFQARFEQAEPDPEASADDAAEGPDALIEEAFLRTLSRFPTVEEVARSRRHLAESEDLTAGLRDLMWALINTKEFIVNH